MGQLAEFTVTATVPASVHYYDATIVDTLPAGLDAGQVTLTGTTCAYPDTTPCADTIAPTTLTPSGQQVGWLLGDLPVDAKTRTIALTYTVPVKDLAGLDAGDTLTNSALLGWDLTDETDVAGMVEKLAHKHGVRLIGVRYELVVRKAPAAGNGVDQDQKQGIACLDETMRLVENDLPKLTQRANAWATGDMRTLQSLVQQTHYEPCVVAAINGDFEHQLAIPDLPRRIEDAWFEAADSALVRNRYTVAIDDLYTEQDWDSVFPEGVINLITIDGQKQLVPVGVHRGNVMFYNKDLLSKNGIEVSDDWTMDDYFKAADTLKAAGVPALALGSKDTFAIAQLFENTLLAALGPDDAQARRVLRPDQRGRQGDLTVGHR